MATALILLLATVLSVSGILTQKLADGISESIIKLVDKDILNDISKFFDSSAMYKLPDTVNAVMLGRGLIADPALARKIRGGAPAEREELERFTQRLYREYQAAYGGRGQAAQRMKELWFYLIHLFDGGEKYAKKMRRVSHPEEYELLEAGIYRDLTLRRDAVGPL